jgi:serine/threonine-protein kinase
MGNDGQLLVVAWHNHKLLSIDPETGWVRIVCGSGAGFAGDGGPASEGALFKQPNDAVRANDGSIYIVDQQNQRIRKIDPDGLLSTFAGTGVDGFSGDGGQAIDAEFYWEYGSNPNPSGGITIKGDVLYVADTYNNRIRSIDVTTGIIDTIAGNGEAAYAGDGGAAVDASLRGPRDLEIGPDGDLYIADTDNGAVRAVDLDSGEIRTVVGTGQLGLDDVEGLPATETQLRRPMGVAFDPEGNLYVMDTLNDRIVRVVL